MEWMRSVFLVHPCGAQHAPVVRPPFTFGKNLWPGFEFFPCAHARPRAAASGDEEVGLSNELVSAQHATVLLQDPRHPALGCQTSVNVQIVERQVPHVMLCIQAVRMKSLQAAERPAGLAPAGFNCWQSTGLGEKLGSRKADGSGVEKSLQQRTEGHHPE
jgi:hypothetical protein